MKKLPDSAEGYQEILDYSNVSKDEVKNIKIDINPKNAVTVTTNEDGTTTVRNTVKKASEASAGGNMVIANSFGATSGNTNTGNSSNTGNTGGNSTGNTTNSNNGSTSSSGGNSSSSNGNTGGSTSGGSSTGGSSSSNTGNSSGNSGNSSSGGSSSSEPAPSEPKVITYWVRCKLCGTYVESTVSLDDAFNKISNYKCVDSGGYEYVDFMKHSSYSYGANEG